MAGLVNYGKTGTLTLNGVSMNCPAWDVPDLTPLWGNRVTKGANAVIAGVVGSRPKRRRYDEIDFQLPGFLIGHADRLGVAAADASVGLAVNIDYLVANVVDPVADGGATHVDAVLTVPGQTDRTAEVQAEIVFGAVTGTPTWRYSRVPFVLRLTVPAGRFA